MPSLVFHATDSSFVPANTAEIMTALQQAGVIASRWQSPAPVAGERYLIGDAFLSLVTFMGCAPAIELQPDETNPASTEFCHIEVGPVKQELEFIRGSEHLVSRCPHCRQRHANWDSIPGSLRYTCDKCGEESHLSEYDWKQTAGCGHFFIYLHGIYPQEALPTPALFKILEDVTSTPWSHFYIQ